MYLRQRVISKETDFLTLFVDNTRVDDYNPDGTTLRPFKTLESAFSYIDSLPANKKPTKAKPIVVQDTGSCIFLLPNQTFASDALWSRSPEVSIPAIQLPEHVHLELNSSAVQGTLILGKDSNVSLLRSSCNASADNPLSGVNFLALASLSDSQNKIQCDFIETTFSSILALSSEAQVNLQFGAVSLNTSISGSDVSPYACAFSDLSQFSEYRGIPVKPFTLSGDNIYLSRNTTAFYYSNPCNITADVLNIQAKSLGGTTGICAKSSVHLDLTVGSLVAEVAASVSGIKPNQAIVHLKFNCVEGQFHIQQDGVLNNNVKRYEYFASVDQRVFEGVDRFGNTLNYLPGNIEVYVNNERMGLGFLAEDGKSIRFNYPILSGSLVSIVPYVDSALAPNKVVDSALIHTSYRLPSGVSGGTSALNSWQMRQFNTIDFNGLPNTTLNQNFIHLYPGKYKVEWQLQFYMTGKTQNRLVSSTGLILVSDIQNDIIDDRTVSYTGYFSLDHESDVHLESYTELQTDRGLGFPKFIGEEKYSTLTIQEISSVESRLENNFFVNQVSGTFTGLHLSVSNPNMVSLSSGGFYDFRGQRFYSFLQDQERTLSELNLASLTVQSEVSYGVFIIWVSGQDTINWGIDNHPGAQNLLGLGYTSFLKIGTLRLDASAQISQVYPTLTCSKTSLSGYSFNEPYNFVETTDWQSVPLLAKITPCAANSKVKITVSLSVSSAYNNFLLFRFKRGTSVIGCGNTSDVSKACSFVVPTSNNLLMDSVTYTFIDTPGITSELTYSLDMRMTAPATLASLNVSSHLPQVQEFISCSSIILEEIV